MGSPSRYLSFRSLVTAVSSGVLMSLTTGFVENQPAPSIIGYRYYGRPLVWRVTKTLEPTEYMLANLAIDVALWFAVSYLALFFLERILRFKLKVDLDHMTLLLLLALFLPFGLVMDFVHESGHAMWGIASGGRLTYMQIGYFEVYPGLALAEQFVLGMTRVSGLGSQFAHGFFLLGGSMTTNIVAWSLGLMLAATRLGDRTRLALKVLGLFGLLDVPFYVIFPQIGLLHWIILGGDRPEPLLGARKIGVPDSAFYVATFLLTIGLIFLYFEPIRYKAEKYIRTFLSKISGSDQPSRCTRPE